MKSSLRCAVFSTAFLFVSVVLATPDLARAGKGPIDEPGELGPYAVGRTTFEVSDPSRSRDLPVDAWYPVDPEDAGGPPSVYDLIFTGIVSDVALDEPAVSSEGPFPLVAFSHGSNGLRFQSYFLAEHLASHGFVVVAPDHIGNTAGDILTGTSDPPDVVALNRPQDISFVISAILQRSDTPGDAFEGSVDAERIGVTGHSFGAFTALAVAAGYQTVPADERVDAIAPIAPATGGLSDEDLARVDVPTLVLGGTADIVTPISESVRVFSLVSGRPLYRVDVIDAGHNSFTNICDFADALIGAEFPPELLEFLLGNIAQGCAPDLIPIDEAHEVTNFYETAFMKRQVEGDPRYQRYLTLGRAVSRDLPVDFFKKAGGP